MGALGLFGPQLDGEGDELGVLLHEVLDLVALGELLAVILQVQGDLGATAQSVALGVLADGEGRVSSGLPDVPARAKRQCR